MFGGACRFISRDCRAVGDSHKITFMVGGGGKGWATSGCKMGGERVVPKIGIRFMYC